MIDLLQPLSHMIGDNFIPCKMASFKTITGAFLFNAKRTLIELLLEPFWLNYCKTVSFYKYECSHFDLLKNRIFKLLLKVFCIIVNRPSLKTLMQPFLFIEHRPLLKLLLEQFWSIQNRTLKTINETILIYSKSTSIKTNTGTILICSKLAPFKTIAGFDSSNWFIQSRLLSKLLLNYFDLFKISLSYNLLEPFWFIQNRPLYDY